MRVVTCKEFMLLPPGTVFYPRHGNQTALWVKANDHNSEHRYCALQLTVGAREVFCEPDDDQEFVVLEQPDLESYKQSCETQLSDNTIGHLEYAAIKHGLPYINRYVEAYGLAAFLTRLVKASDSLDLAPTYAIHYLVTDLELEWLRHETCNL